jgi:ABC-2 type transport system permease protein
MLRKIWSLSIKDFLHLKNDWWLPAFMLIGGALELLLVGWATSRPISNLPLTVLDYDHSPHSRQLVTGLENTGTFTIDQYASSYETILHQMDRGQIYAAVVIPPDYSENLSSNSAPASLQVLINGAESTPAQESFRSIEGLVNSISTGITLQRFGIAPENLAGFEPSLRVWFNEQLKESLYTTPAELALMLEFTILLFAALTFSRERELGTLEQLLVMPFSSLELIIGKSIPVIMVGFVDFVLLLGIVHFFFDVPVHGSPALLLTVALVYILVELGKGMTISVISRTQHQAFLVVMVIGMIDFMFTGYAAPVESMPAVLRFIANFIPAHHWLGIVRGIMLKGAGLETLWPQVLALILLGLVIGGFSLAIIRRTLEWE